MPDFGAPFSGLANDRKLNKDELIRAMRFLVAAEFEATQMYDQLADSIDDDLTKKVLKSVSDEERVHAGEFSAIVERLSSDEKEKMDEGRAEVDDIEKKASNLMRLDQHSLVRLAQALDEKGMTKEADQITRSMIKTAQSWFQPVPQQQLPSWSYGSATPSWIGQGQGQMASSNPVMMGGPFGAIGATPMGVGRGEAALNRGGGWSNSMGAGNGLIQGMMGAFQTPRSSQMTFSPSGRGLLGDRTIGVSPSDLARAAMQAASSGGYYDPAAADAMLTGATGGPGGNVTMEQALNSYLSGNPVGMWGAPNDDSMDYGFTGSTQDQTQLEKYNPMFWPQGNPDLSGAAYQGMSEGTWQGTGMTPQQQQMVARNSAGGQFISPGQAPQLGPSARQTSPTMSYQQAVQTYNALLSRGDPRAQQVGQQAMQLLGNMTPQQQQGLVQYYNTPQGQQQATRGVQQYQATQQSLNTAGSANEPFTARPYNPMTNTYGNQQPVQSFQSNQKVKAGAPVLGK